MRSSSLKCEKWLHPTKIAPERMDDIVQMFANSVKSCADYALRFSMISCATFGGTSSY